MRPRETGQPVYACVWDYCRFFIIIRLLKLFSRYGWIHYVVSFSALTYLLVKDVSKT